MPDTTRSGGTRRRRFQPRGDLQAVPRLRVSNEQWRDQIQTLAVLRIWAEDRAAETIDWYLRDKQAKRWGSRLLRAGAVLAAVAGGALPLLSGTLSGINPNLGYIFLAVAAGCVAFDHFFGLSNGWMRDMAAVQVLQGKLARFQLDWARWQASQAVGPTAVQGPIAKETLNAALDLIDGFMTGVASVTDSETGQWIADFSSSIAALRQQASPSVTSAQDIITWGSQNGNLPTG